MEDRTAAPAWEKQNSPYHLSCVLRFESDFARWETRKKHINGKAISIRKGLEDTECTMYGCVWVYLCVCLRKGEEHVPVRVAWLQALSREYAPKPNFPETSSLASLPALERGSNRVSWPDFCPHGLPPPFHHHASCFS